jgi:hypothetical protein
MLLMSTDLNLFCKLSFVDTLLREHWDFLLTISGSIRWDTLNNAFSVVELPISGARVLRSSVVSCELERLAPYCLRNVDLGVNTPGTSTLCFIHVSEVCLFSSGEMFG